MMRMESLIYVKDFKKYNINLNYINKFDANSLYFNNLIILL